MKNIEDPQSERPVKTEKSKSLQNPAWNFWQALFVILLVYLLEFSLGWFSVVPNPRERAGMIEYLIRGYGEACVTLAIIIIFLWFVCKSKDNFGMGSFRLRYLSRGVSAGIGIFLVSGLLGGLVIRMFGEPAPQSFAVAVDSADTWWQLAFIFILGCVIVPLKEELLYRGLVYPPLRKIYGINGGLVGSAAFFSMMHFDATRFLPIFLGGLCLQWLYERNKSLWPSIIAHGVWNGLMMVLMLLQKGWELT